MSETASIWEFPEGVLVQPEPGKAIRCTEDRPGEALGPQIAGGATGIVLSWLTEMERTHSFAAHMSHNLAALVAMATGQVVGLGPTHEECAGRLQAPAILQYADTHRDEVWANAKLLNPNLAPGPDGLQSNHFKESMEALGRLVNAGLVKPEIGKYETVKPLWVRNPENPANPADHKGRVMIATGDMRVVDTYEAWERGGAYGYSHGQLANLLPSIVEKLRDLFGGQADPNRVLDATTYYQAAVAGVLPGGPSILAVGYNQQAA